MVFMCENDMFPGNVVSIVDVSDPLSFVANVAVEKMISCTSQIARCIP